MEEKFEFKVIDLRRTAKITPGGKRLRVRAAIVVGNRNGKVGFGMAKGLDASDAILKARKSAEKNLIEVPIVEGTLPYEVEEKLGSARVLIKPAKKGKGLIVGSVVRVILDLAGYTDATSKILGVTKNPLINAQITFKALAKLSQNFLLKQKLKKENANPSN